MPRFEHYNDNSSMTGLTSEYYPSSGAVKEEMKNVMLI